ncbi:VanW family protein [Pseudactinotalea sp.]|uniref:VanW family protein n=1 Tax=Pseudactinotalea sp. TaxID=1926260 RepID=UPI003B3A6DEE
MQGGWQDTRGAVAATAHLATAARSTAGAAVRRIRREVDWQRRRSALQLRVEAPELFEHLVAQHASPTRRVLAGVDAALQVSKETNLALAADRLDGRVLRPGQRLSFWFQVGRPTARRGYLPGVVLSQGRVISGVGGGLCQLTNLLYWMTLHTPLTVVERWRHSYDVFPDSGRTLPFASGATCAWPSLDLQIENRTAHAFRLSVAVVDQELRGSWSSDAAPLHRYRVYEAAHRIANDSPGVHTRHNVLRRTVLDLDGLEIADELVAENHALMMYEPFLGAGPVRLPLDPV